MQASAPPRSFTTKKEFYAQFKKNSIAHELWLRFLKNKTAVIGLIILAIIVAVAVAAPWITDYDNVVIKMNIGDRLQHPSMAHLFGTDELGRDILARIVYGARVSLLIGISAIAVSLVVGLVLGLLGSLRVGNRFVHTGKPTPEGYAAAGGTLYFGVPTVWSRVVADPQAAAALSSARLLVSGSAALPVPVFDRLTELTGHAPVERYGATESLITVSTRADGERRPGWVGLPLDGVQTRLRHEDGSAAPHDGETIGSLQVRTPTLFDGYLNRPDATAEAFEADGWYRTGDAAVIDDAGMHRIVGRESVDLIKSGGYRIGAGEVETVLLGHPGVTEAVVVGVPDEDLGQRIVAFVVGDAEPTDLISFASFLATVSPTYLIPKANKTLSKGIFNDSFNPSRIL